MIRVNGDFRQRARLDKNFNAGQCFNCGTCTALCPVGMDILPRQLFRYVLLGAEEKIMEYSDSIYSCLLCRMCEENCPEGVLIAENIRTLRRYLVEDVYNI